MKLIVWLYRQLFCCKRRLCPHSTRHISAVPINKLPWFWVGVKRSDKTICVTDIVNKHVRFGVPVTRKLLSELTHIDDDSIWKYIDAKTLEEKEFPPEGIVIEDDTLRQPVSNT
jgi:hypothetical protein